MLDRNGSVHVVDFGVASAAGTDALTMTGTVLGTAGYLSPEQAQGEKATPASDRYSLAIVAFELLSGRRPFENDSITAEAAAHVNAPVPSIAQICERLPAELDAVIRQALAKDPAERFETASEFVAALRAALAAVGGAIAAIVLANGNNKSKGAAPFKPRTVTVTRQGSTGRTTTPPPTTAPPPSTAPTSLSGSALNDEGYSKMQAGDYGGALPLLQQAVAKLSGVGYPDEAYANYNLGYTLLQLGRCNEAVPYLEKAQRLEPQRHEPKDALKRAKHC